MGDKLSEEWPSRRDPGIVFSQGSVNVGTRFKRTMSCSIPQQSVTAGLMGRQLGKKPAETAFWKIRKARPFAQLDVWICYTGPGLGGHDDVFSSPASVGRRQCLSILPGRM